MGRSLLLRDVPGELSLWIEKERGQQLMSQREFVLNLLAQASREKQEPSLFDQIPEKRSPPSAGEEALQAPFKFVDLFAGIGGMRQGLHRVGGQCVFTCEWDRYAQKTYRAWFGETPHGDIRAIKPADIPDHDLLAAGFPCQPFSIAGVSKKKSLGRAHGFKDAAQGTLFFQLATIIQIRRPPIVLLENVKNLMSHDQGRTWDVIRSRLEELRYRVFAKVIDAAGWVPQHRERIFIVGFDRDVFGDDPPFKFPAPRPSTVKFRSILEPRPDEKYTLTDHLWRYLQEYAKRHQAKGNGFGFGIADLDGISRTLSARYFKDGSEILIPQKGKNPRRLTPLEASRLMGFDERLPIVVSDTQAYRQFGNAVVPPVVEAVGREIIRVVRWHLLRDRGSVLKRSGNGH
jgi:DNA (cytosine-5)-methyltransferase 1